MSTKDTFNVFEEIAQEIEDDPESDALLAEHAIELAMARGLTRPEAEALYLPNPTKPGLSNLFKR